MTPEPRDPKPAPEWAFGREGHPVSPGLQPGEPPPRGALSGSQEWFKDMKFGMFVHWGLESLQVGRTDWPSFAYRDPNWDARSLDLRFGERFDPAAWVDLAQRAGQRYLCFVTKHHLGFANYASRANPYNSAALGPHRDFLRPLADECHRRHMPLFTYLSLPDMHHSDFRPLDSAAWERYRQFVLAQLEELATDYGPLAGFWLDPGPWNGPDYRYPLGAVKEMTRERFPAMLVGGRDWDGAEQNYDRRVFLDESARVLSYEVFQPGGGPQPDAWPFEVCDTLNRSWFHNPADRDRKDVPTLIRRLVEVAGRGGNYLLNHGPLASGEVNPEDALSLEAVGQWLHHNAEAVYCTRPLGTPAQPWGWPLVFGDKAYLHILNWPGSRLRLPGLSRRVAGAGWLHGGPLRFEQKGEEVTLLLPDEAPDALDSIAVLELAHETALDAATTKPHAASRPGVPGLVKTGAQLGSICETTPFVWQGRLVLLVNLRPASAKSPADHSLQLRDVAEDRALSTFGVGYSLASAFVWEDTLYVYAARSQEGRWHDVTEFRSSDLVNWSQPRVVIAEEAGEELFNQSVCRAGDRFVMAYESNDRQWPGFTIKFAASTDLEEWQVLPDAVFGLDRYTACPCLRYVDGWFYMLYLERRSPSWRFETFLARSRDLRRWEPSPRNPIVAPGPEEGEACNTSDPDLGEFGGKVLLYYSYGDQQTWTQLTRAEFAGTLGEFFAACCQDG